MSKIKSKEEIRDVVGYEGLYKISNAGILLPHWKEWISGKGCKRNNFGRSKPMGCKDNKGYVISTLTKNGVKRTFKVHRLVAFAFIPNPENKPHINHKNGIKDDNRVENLEWCYNIENIHHAIETGLWDDSILGENNNKSKLKKQDIINIKSSPLSSWEIAKKYGVSYNAIKKIRLNKSWKRLNSLTDKTTP